ncbi:MAG: hypothetical protein HYY04_09780 [Chloroflexi bacterium]|nr:hypothetical protein [Chloroflexota bacterium]
MRAVKATAFKLLRQRIDVLFHKNVMVWLLTQLGSFYPHPAIHGNAREKVKHLVCVKLEPFGPVKWASQPLIAAELPGQGNPWLFLLRDASDDGSHTAERCTGALGE